MGLAVGLLLPPEAGVGEQAIKPQEEVDGAEPAAAEVAQGGQEAAAGEATPARGGSSEADAASEERRRASFLDMLHSNMAARQQAKQQGCGALERPSLAAALASGTRKAARKVRSKILAAATACSPAQ
jgi:hypothetical protein